MGDKHYTGEPCPNCERGQLRVRSSRKTGDGVWSKRYYRCVACSYSVESVVPASCVMRRNRSAVVAYNGAN